MLLITQPIKAARSLIGWEQNDLAVHAGISISTVRRLEGLKGAIEAHFETIEGAQTPSIAPALNSLDSPRLASGSFEISV